MKLTDLFVECELLEPLSYEELYKYFIMYRDGDLSARDMIINSNIRIVISRVVKKFNKTCYDMGELISVGLIGLINAVDSFDIFRNTYFSTYAIRCIDNEIFKYMKKNNRFFNNLSYDYTYNDDIEMFEISMMDYLCDGNADMVDNYENKELYMRLREIISELPDRYRDIMLMYYGFVDDRAMSQKEIGNVLNITNSYVSQCIFKSLDIIKYRLFKDGYMELNVDELNISKKIRKKLDCC